MNTAVRGSGYFTTGSVGDDAIAPQTPSVDGSATGFTPGGVALPGSESQLRSDPRGSVGENRLVLLGMVLAELPGVAFSDVVRLLGVSPTRLERIMHGSESIPRRYDQKWKAVAEILSLLHGVLKPSATGRWINTSIPALGGLTPLVAIEKGKAGEVLAVVRAYHDPSFL